MTIPRVVGLLIVLVVIGIAAVAMRVEQARHARRIQELQFRQTELRQQIWGQEMELARLRAPGMIRQRAGRLGLNAGGGPAQEVSPDRR